MLLEQKVIMADFQETSLPSEMILQVPWLNKGTGFTEEERTELGLHGLIPSHVSTLQEQVALRYQNFASKISPIEKYLFLSQLQNHNEVLFYRFCLEYAEEVLPYIYTPTVGSVSLDYSALYSYNRGLFLSYSQRHLMGAIINKLHADLDVIVVTDGSRILGLGDLGIGGMAIPVGKLSLYTLFGGIHPARTLPILLDVGTNNEKLLADPNYIGWRHERIDGTPYDDFIETFVTCIKAKLPDVLLQWEDFSKNHASQLLHRYRDKIASFNDDIQGTASVTLAALLSAIKASKTPLENHRFVIYGAGSAGIGIADLILRELLNRGVSEAKACSLFYLFNSRGLIHTGTAISDVAQRRYAQPKEVVLDWNPSDPHRITLLEAIPYVKPTVLIGVSGQGGAFTEEIVCEMQKHVARPVIFPLSNPTSRSEAIPEELYRWTDGRAIVATGSPFPPVSFGGKSYAIAQCNNVYIYPGLGLGLIAVKASTITDEMFVRAAEILASHSPMLQDPTQPLFPYIRQLREISYEIACAIAQLALEQGLARKLPESSIESMISQTMWFPDYHPLKRPKDFT